MESNLEPMINSLLTLAILNFIPIIIYALWLEYYEKELKELLIKSTEFDRDSELEKIRFFSLMVLLFEFMLFLGADGVRSAFPFYADLTVVLASVAQISLQMRAEKTVQLTRSEYEPVFPIMLKALRAWLVAALICGSFSICGIILARWAAKNTINSEILGVGLTLIGGLAGMAIGLILNFALTPYHILKILPASPMGEHPVRKMIKPLFDQYGIRLPKLWIIELKKLRIFDLIIVGFRLGRGPFAYSLFLSQHVLSTLDENEIRSLLTIEVSQLRLNHVRNRMILASALIINSLILSLTTGLTALQISSNPGFSEFLGTFVGFIFFIISMRWVAIQKQAQEFEADTHALDQLNLDFLQFSNALRKLDFSIIAERHPENVKNMPLIGFPDTERRLFLLSNYLAKQGKTQKLDEQKLAA